MRTQTRPLLAAVLAGFAMLMPGCNRGAKPVPVVTSPPPQKDEIPPKNLAAFVKAHQEGVGYMERYDYPRATEAFRRAHELAPGLIAGSINLAIATLNDTGSEAEKSHSGAGKPPAGKFEAALELLDEVLRRDPKNLHAHYCRGIILGYLGRMEEAHPEFVFVRDHDPSDANAWLQVGLTLTDPTRPGLPAGRKQAGELVRIYTESLKRNPYNAVALYRLAQAQSFAGRSDQFKTLNGLLNELDPERNPRGPGDSGRTVYGEMGKYATVIDLFPASGKPAEPARAPRFEKPKPITVSLPEGDRWVKTSDFAGKLAVLGRARARFGAAVATFDADGDGLQDLLLAASVVGPKGVRDALLLNAGEGKFRDASREFGLPDDLPSLCVAAGDFDADRNVDLYLAGIGEDRLYRNVGGKKLEDITRSLGEHGPPSINPMARWMDLDQDGDLDLYVVRNTASENADAAFTGAATPPPGLKNAAFRNDGVPPASNGPADTWAPIAVMKGDQADSSASGLTIKFTPWAADSALLGSPEPHTGVAVLDLDDDRDFDLILASDGGSGPSAILNDRLGRFTAAKPQGLDALDPASGLLTIDMDKDGRADLVATSASGRVSARRNATIRDAEGAVHVAFEVFPLDARRWRSAGVLDLDLDGSLDLLGLPEIGSASLPGFARAEGSRFVTKALPLGVEIGAPILGLVATDLIGDALPDLLIVRDGGGPRIARNLGNGHHWIGLEIGGRWDVKPKHMRTNSEGLGVRVTVEGDGLLVPYDHTTPESGPAQSVAPIVLGLGSHEKARLVRLKWPDGVLQCELDEDADRLMALTENSRKEGSCPVLFTWNGERMVCLGDFLGGGGLGYLVAPGVYGEPDRDEAVAIAGDQLKAEGGSFRMSITEPMSELAYLDKVTLDVVDRPSGVSAAPDERFAPGGNRPTGKLLSWEETIEFRSATDLKGKDVSDALRRADRIYADDFKRLSGWIGYAEEHGIILDFAERLADLGPNRRVALVLVGYTEYPYSQTNYAAATAGVPLKPPILEHLRPDGSWETFDPDPGYPAGMPRTTILELDAQRIGQRCVLRLRTNMEIGWDQAFLAPILEDAPLRVTTIPVGRAALSHRGYTREVSPDGRLPLTYDYRYVDPAPLAGLVGKLTRFGDVKPLVTDDDDRFCVIGPGDEVRLEFPASEAPPLPEGWTRSFVLRTVGYCKDADPFTSASDTVGPLPWRGMPPYPFGREGARPEDEGYRSYLETYQTRSVGR